MRWLWPWLIVALPSTVVSPFFPSSDSWLNKYVSSACLSVCLSVCRLSAPFFSMQMSVRICHLIQFLVGFPGCLFFCPFRAHFRSFSMVMTDLRSQYDRYMTNSPYLHKLTAKNVQANVTVADVAKTGPGLAFVVYPEGLAQIAYAPVWAVLFFFMMVSYLILERYWCGRSNPGECPNYCSWCYSSWLLTTGH